MGWQSFESALAERRNDARETDKRNRDFGDDCENFGG